MVFTTKKFVRELKRYKEGIIIGAVAGLIASYYVISAGYDLSSLVGAGKGLLDSVMGRSAPLELATYKLYGVFTFFGATIGLVADMLIDKFHLKK